MADLYSKKRRSEIMGRIASKDTIPEVRVRQALHGMGYRFRLHRDDLPGKPDIVLPKWKTVILVHGCFWHGHDCCEGHVPKSNSAYWAPKLDRNRRRTQRTLASSMHSLHRIVIWSARPTACGRSKSVSAMRSPKSQAA